MLLPRLVAATAAVTLLSACAGAADMDMGGGSGMMGGAGGGSAPAVVDGAASATVEAGDLFFSLDELEATAGEPLNITLTNGGEVFHDLHVDDTEFALDADPGQTVSGSLTIDEPGTYTFRCTVPGHAAAGMEGTVTVTG